MKTSLAAGCQRGRVMLGVLYGNQFMTRRRWLGMSLPRILVLGSVLAAFAGGCMQLEQRERELTFRPSRAAAAWFSGMPDGVREVSLPIGTAANAPKVDAWWWPGDGADAPAVLYLHGSRWNLTGQLRRIEQLHAFGFAVFAIDYRGFGKSDGD